VLLLITLNTDILMLNAGIMAAPPGLTKEGYELQMGTNHMGHALLTKLLLPVLDKTAKGDAHSDVRIVSLSSAGHKLTAKGGIQLDTLKTPADRLGAYERYGQSKLANILWIRQMAKHYPQFKAVAVHPGVVSTNLLAGTNGSALSLMLKAASALHFFSTVEDGVKNQLWAAVANNVQSGEYYEPIGKAGSASAFGKDDKLATKLWDWTEEELAKYTS
jgi:NAD(P)-dependent dehydrogenase (short-subunit alcohol dehydrogenase family)